MAVNTGKTQLRAAIADRGLTLTDVANACGVTRGAVGQWFIDGPNWRPIPGRHMATIRELLASSPQERGQVEAFERLAEGQSAGNPGAPARRRSPPPRPPARSPIHYPEHWALPPVMPAPMQGHVRPATGPQHSDFVAEHNYASQHSGRRDVRFPKWPI
jgi:hypothetical protein